MRTCVRLATKGARDRASLCWFSTPRSQSQPFLPIQGRRAEAEAILRRAMVEGAAVPSLWTYEIGHVLLKAERNRETASDAEEAIGALLRLPIIHDAAQSPTWVRIWQQLARSVKLSFYNAAFLDLALTRALPLATFDGGLRQAALRSGVALLPLEG